MSEWRATQLSEAARQFADNARRNGWTEQLNIGDTVEYVKGDRYVAVYLTITGGISRVVTDRGRYVGAGRLAWAIEQLGAE